MTVLYLPWGIAEGENTQTHVQAKNIAERERGTDREGVLPDGCMVPALWIFFLAGHEARLSRKVPRDYQRKHHSAQHLTAPFSFHGPFMAASLRIPRQFHWHGPCTFWQSILKYRKKHAARRSLLMMHVLGAGS